jgi:chromosome segregation ATPase
MSILQRLTTMKKPETQAQSEPTSSAVQDQEAGGNKAPARPNALDDPLVAKLIDIVQQVVESREALKAQVEERDRALVVQEDQIRELQYDKGFLEKKMESVTAELNRAKESALEMKTQYDQLLAEFNSQRLQQENRIRELQERLSERELTNRQLMLDLNRNQKDFELRMRELETRERDKEVKIQHLEQKLRQAQSENERLTRIISDFASQAINTARLSVANEAE